MIFSAVGTFSLLEIRAKSFSFFELEKIFETSDGPWHIDITKMIAVMPITIPRIVKKDRDLCAFNAVRAVLIKCRVVIFLYRFRPSRLSCGLAFERISREIPRGLLI